MVVPLFPLFIPHTLSLVFVLSIKSVSVNAEIYTCYYYFIVAVAAVPKFTTVQFISKKSPVEHQPLAAAQATDEDRPHPLLLIPRALN